MITLDQGGAGATIAEIIPAPGRLARRVQWMWLERPVAHGVPPRRTWRIVPDPCGHLLYHRMAEGTRLSLVGPRTRPVDVGKGRRRISIGARLQPWALNALFGVSPVELRDHSVTLGDVLGQAGVELKERLDGSPPGVCVEVLVQWLQRRADVEEDSSELRGRASSLLLRDTHVCGDAADTLGISSRTLRTLMRSQVGLSPKTYARIVRLHRALGRATSGDGWAAIAVDCGYYDQAHMIRDFLDLLGESPEVWRARARCLAGPTPSPDGLRPVDDPSQASDLRRT